MYVKANQNIISVRRVIELVEFADEVVTELVPDASDLLHAFAASDCDDDDLDAVKTLFFFQVDALAYCAFRF